MPATQLAILVALIILSAFFSGIETALVSLSNVKASALLKQKRRGAKALNRLKQDPHRLIITILIGNNLVNIGAASFATVVFTDLLGSSGVGVATGVMTFLILVFGEITPKTFCAQNAERISLLVARLVEILSYILWPLVKLFGLISKVVIKLFSSGRGEQLSEEELKTIVMMGKKEGLLSKEVAKMMHNVLEFRGTKVTEVMTPRVDMNMIEGSKTLKQVINYVVKTPYSRYPVYMKNRDDIVGILDVDDVLRYAKDGKFNKVVKDIMRPIDFVPESKKIDDLLTEFERKQLPMVIVVDEYGDVSGMVTVDDILEEIVGDIFDKSARSSDYIKKVNEKIIAVDAKAPLEELAEEFNFDVKQGNFETIAGFIENKLQKIPKKGEKVKLKNLTIEVDEVSNRKIKSVKIIRSSKK